MFSAKKRVSWRVWSRIKEFEPFQIFYFAQNIPKKNKSTIRTELNERPFRHGHAT